MTYTSQFLCGSACERQRKFYSGRTPVRDAVRDASCDSENRTRAGCTPTGCASPPSAARFSYWPPFVKVVFLFLYFLFSFFTKYIFDSEIYKNIPRPPRYRAAGTWPPGRGIYEKKFAEKIARRSLGAGRPAAGRPALAARLLGDRLSHPYIRVGWSPPPLICITKIPKTKKKRGREGERRSPVGFSSQRLQITKILLRFTNRDYVVIIFVETVD